MNQPVAVAPSSWDCFAPDTFADQVTLVTGAAGGMGREVARAFHQLGAHVWLSDLDGAALETTAKELRTPAGPELAVFPADVADPSAVAELYRRIDERHGRIDNVVSCAAVITAAAALEMSTEHWDRVLRINLIGTFSVLQEAVRRMTARGTGQIVAVASDAGKRGGGGLVADAAYAASKAGVLSVVKSLAREFAGTGVRINALTPGPTDTPMHGSLSDALKERIAAGLPIGRMGHPKDMAAAIAFLCSPAAAFIYGASLNVDGGAMFE
ncbi:MAG: SDR family oxidoreductase [Streptosporangiales bacterium]|nr:SDR family oxidoreductase [Streptosporangiales bacterium]